METRWLPQTWLMGSVLELLLLLLCAASSQDFDWTRTQKTPFVYGTFPTGRSQDPEDVPHLQDLPLRWEPASGCSSLTSALLCRLLLGGRKLRLPDGRSLEQRREGPEHLGRLRPPAGQHPRQPHRRRLLRGLLQVQGGHKPGRCPQCF